MPENTKRRHKRIPAKQMWYRKSQQGLKNFLDEFLGLLQQEGFSAKDLIAALATWAHGQENSQLLTRYLEHAATEAQRISSR